MDLNNTNVKIMGNLQAGTKSHVMIHSITGTGSLYLESYTSAGWKRLSKPITKADIDKHGPDGAVIPIDVVPGELFQIVNQGFAAISIDYITTSA